MQNKIKSIYITGINGWLGHSFISAFENGIVGFDKSDFFENRARIIGFDRQYDPSLINTQNTFYKGDIRNFDDCNTFLQLRESEILVHMASLIHPQLWSKDFDAVNVGGTRNLIKAAKINGIKKIIYVSSNSPIGCNKNKHEPFTEDSVFNPYLGYGKSKMEAEKIIQDSGINFTILRAPWFYGPFQPDRQTLFFKLIASGKFPIIGSGQNLRSMVFTENLIQGILLSIISEKSDNQVFWIADQKPYAMKEIIQITRDAITDLMNVETKQCKNFPGFIADFAYICDKVIQWLGFYQQKIHVLSELNKNIFCSIQKAQDILGYQPKIDLYQGMVNSLKWLKKNRGFKI